MNAPALAVLPKLNKFDYYFIHIPKNGGTAFERYFMSHHCGHHYLQEYPMAIWEKTIAIIRNPLERVASIYNYSRMDKSYWHSLDGSTPYGKNKLYDYCTTNTFAEFVQDICNGRFDDHIHLVEQYRFIISPGNIVPVNLMRFEQLEKDLSRFLGLRVHLPKVNVSSVSHEVPLGFTKELKELLYKKYEIDFKIHSFLQRHKTTYRLPMTFLGAYH
jgi:Sulfotransferase family.